MIMNKYTGVFFAIFLLLFVFCDSSIKVSALPVKLFRKEGYELKPAGSGAIVVGGKHVLTTAHILTNAMAKRGVSLDEQYRELKQLGAIFMSQTIECKHAEHGHKYLDGAVLVPMGYFECQILDYGINPVKICNHVNCFDDAYTYSSKTGFKEDLMKYLGIRSFQKGDSGSVVATKSNNDAVAVVYGHGNTEIAKNEYPTSYLFMLDNNPGLAAIVRVAVGKTEIKRAFPKGCKTYIAH
jgi:hypothetical protein